MSVLIAIKKYFIIKLLFFLIFVLIGLIITFLVLRMVTALDIFNVLVTMSSSLAALTGSIIALSIPFIMKKLEDKKKAEEKELITRKMLIIIRNLIMYCLNYWHLRKKIKIPEDKINIILQKFKKGSSILANLEDLKSNKNILPRINTVFREVHENTIRFGQDSTANDRYDIFINDRYLITINYNYAIKLDETYLITHDINIYDLLKNKRNLDIDIQDCNKSFKNIIYACKGKHNIELKFNKSLQIYKCEICNNLKVKNGKNFCLKDKNFLEDLDYICENFNLKKI